MFRRRKSTWDRYLAAATKTQGAGADPASAAKEPEKAQETRRASRAGRFAHAAGRAALGAARTAAGLLEFAVWLGLNAAIALAVIAAAQAAGAKLPPWLVDATKFVQEALARAARAFGLGA